MRQQEDLTVPAADVDTVRRICRSFLYTTRWAGWLGDPIPRSHRGRRNERGLREIRHERAVAASVLGEAPEWD